MIFDRYTPNEIHQAFTPAEIQEFIEYESAPTKRLASCKCVKYDRSTEQFGKMRASMVQVH